MKEGDEMLIERSSAFDENNLTIPFARRVVREHIGNIAAAGRLQAAALDQKAVVAQLAMGPLSQYVIQDIIKLSMVERWVMEAISAQARRGGQEGA
jgi:hypothetical protein